MTLVVENLELFYGDAQALAGVSIEVEEGAIVAIVGANGAGKTSLIRTIAGMLSPAAGRILYHGEDIAGWPSHRVCDLGIGQVAEGRQVFPTLTVMENLRWVRCCRAPAAGERRCWSTSSLFFRGSRNAGGRPPARCPAANNRCWRSGAV